ncbi:NusA family KH domain protein [Pyrolobus fumarii 1A]|uniref:Probable transcription termination protein NusA n=1 Tax=Pyrolobus fumarii (strain DSM 11204 / 1A) TaxID=694429 RepID=G0EEY2_PYRF1|nr:NusA-like transcription termination signal-binding factor [Pyrolobus fumarii]AEM38096.1 NusA family KH domain protein [Pyrolobus fumarii 1A]
MPSNEIRLTAEEIRYMSLLQDLTGAVARDCIIDAENNRIIFIVRPGDAGKVIGRRGTNINRLRKIFNRDVDVVEYADNLEDMVRNIFSSAKILGMRLVTRGDKKILYVAVDPNDKGKAIGRGGRKISLARLVLKRYFDIDDVRIR